MCAAEGNLIGWGKGRTCGKRQAAVEGMPAGFCPRGEDVVFTFRKMTELSIDEAVALWNRSFEGYVVPITLTVEAYLRRMVMEGMSPEKSFAAYDGDLAIGQVLNGFRRIGGKTVGWNGGTGIIPEYRGKGVGRILMERNLELYREEGADLAVLEAFRQNTPAVRLYEKAGYRIKDGLVFYQRTGELPEETFGAVKGGQDGLRVAKGQPRDIASLPFHEPLTAWQTQWPSLTGGETALVRDGDETVGFSLYKRVYDASGGLSAMILFQCEAVPGHPREEAVLRAALRAAFASEAGSCKRMTFNLRKSNETVLRLLTEAGFAPENELVYMVREMEKTPAAP